MSQSSSPKGRETAESLYQYFVELAESVGLDESAEAMEYASPPVLRRALEAARMLMAVREVVGGGGGAAAGGVESADTTELQNELSEKDRELTRAWAENDRLLVQNMEYGKTIKRLQGKVDILQKQVERLYNKNEMQKTLHTIETKKLSEVERLAEEDASPEDESQVEAPEGVEREATAASDESPESPATPEPAAQPAPKKSLNKQLADELQIEAAARAPREEKIENS